MLLGPDYGQHGILLYVWSGKCLPYDDEIIHYAFVFLTDVIYDVELIKFFVPVVFKLLR